MKSPQSNQIGLTEHFHPNQISPLSEHHRKTRGDAEEAPTQASASRSWTAIMDPQVPIQSSESQSAPSRSDVDELIRRKRKAREYKACYPCRTRKVKCDQNVPCRTCIARGHPELCTYHPPDESHPAKRFQWEGNSTPLVSSGLGGSTVTLAKDEWDRICAKLDATEKAFAELRSQVRNIGDVSPEESESPAARATPTRPIDNELRHVTMEGLHTRNHAGETVHLGGSSVPALVMAISKDNNDDPNLQELFNKSILPIFGLDNISATYPFVDLWRGGLPHNSRSGVTQLRGTLPSDSDCLSFLRFYKDTAHVLYPGVADIEKFEAELMTFLINRASLQPVEDGIDGVSDQKIHGKTLYWIGLLFAVLASGTQCSALPRKDRELTAQVFLCCSFECLRFTNFFSHPSIETIETLLVLGNVLSNHMNAGVAWSLLGLTIRLAQTIGLHRQCLPSTPLATKAVRSKVWWAAIWQDSLLSITYDRGVLAGSVDRPPYFLSKSPSSTGTSYDEAMYKLSLVGVEIVRDRATPQKSHSALMKITEHRRDLLDLMNGAADYLRDSRRCKSMRDTLEHWALYLHVSYVTSELCRPAISPTTADQELTKSLRKTCIDNLANTVEAFLGLHNITYFAVRSWAAIHRALSCALLLGILGESSKNDRVRTLLGSLITVLTEATSEFDPEEVSAPIKRSLAALRKLAASGTSAPSLSNTATSGSPSSTQTLDNANAMGVDDASIVGISPLLGLDTGDSPYALMDSIIWGEQKTPPVAMS